MEAAATKSRVRDVKTNVDVAGHTVIEKDANSTMVTNWTVAPAGPSSVTVKTSWRGAGGIGGFFAKTFGPLGLRKIQGEVLENLKKESRSGKRSGLHQRRVGRVLHVAELDQDRRELGPVEPGDVGAWVQPRRSRRGSTAGCPSRPAGRA